jgi:PD-(D/E)XK nuclease superfamily
MQLNSESLKHHELTERIIGVSFEVYNELGHGFLESVYEEALAIAFTQAGIGIQRAGSSSGVVPCASNRGLQG